MLLHNLDFHINVMGTFFACPFYTDHNSLCMAIVSSLVLILTDFTFVQDAVITGLYGLLWLLSGVINTAFAAVLNNIALGVASVS